MRKKSRSLKRLLLILSISITLLFICTVGFLTFIYNKYDLDVNKLTSLNNGVKVYSSTGLDTTLYNTNRSIVNIDDLPDYVLNAFIAIEDKNFYKHKGYDLKRIIKASLVNIKSKSKSQGASTISQQLIKNALLSNDKTYSRKIEEIVLSIKMEKMFSKKQILEMYLNTIYFGSNAYGIENASKIYFNKSAKDLTLNEACCLAGLIKSPSFYSPIKHYENACSRKNLVAISLLKTNKISNDEYENIKDSGIDLYETKLIDNSYEKEAIHEACSLLNIKERELINKKYEIITFKQDDLQDQVVEINSQIVSNAETTTKSSLDSLSIVANNKGHVLSYYSNSNYNLHSLKRQPASLIKPFAVYLPCFKHNILSPASIILDEQINYNGFSPKNADNKFHGYVSVRNALSNSLNIPAVKALDYVGVKKARESLSDFGIEISNSDLNLSLGLGAVKNGVKVLDMLAAYLTLANLGKYNNLCFVDKILDEKGNIIYAHESYEIKVAESEDCFLLNDILKDCAKTGTAKRLASLPFSIASKTGTASNDAGNTDLYNVAYTSEHAMITWISDIDMGILPNNMLSASQPTEINKNISEFLYSSHYPAEFSKPSRIVYAEYDRLLAESDQILAKPQHKIDRYISFDYFKEINVPQLLVRDDTLDLTASMSNHGVSLSFNASKLNKYSVYKETIKGSALIDSISEKEGLVNIFDNDVFKYDTVIYFILDDKNLRLAQIKLKPQDYLMNSLNNEVVSNKKKWLV